MDKVLPPVIFLIGLLTAFFILVVAMSPTISSNLESDFENPVVRNIPDYLLVFEDGTYSTWTPSLYHINTANISDEWPLKTDNQVWFENPQEDAHPIELFTYNGSWGTVTPYQKLAFQQYGGFLGWKTYQSVLLFPDSFTAMYAANDADTDIIVGYKAYIYLRHEYIVAIGGNNASSMTVTAQIENWNFNVTLMHSLNATKSTNPWTIVGQFFSFSLPGIPTWLNALIAAPIFVVIGVCAFIIVRGALPT